MLSVNNPSKAIASPSANNKVAFVVPGVISPVATTGGRPIGLHKITPTPKNKTIAAAIPAAIVRLILLRLFRIPDRAFCKRSQASADVSTSSIFNTVSICRTSVNNRFTSPSFSRRSRKTFASGSVKVPAL